MKRIVSILIMISFALVLNAKGGAIDAKAILDKTASLVTNKGGATAFFSMSGKYGSSNGTISVKGNKFRATTQQVIVWNNGKTQWTYNRNAEEVNVSKAGEGEQTLNPYAFVSIYKQGFNITAKSVGGKYEVHLVAQNKSRSIQEMFITVNKQYQPTQVKMRTSKGWTTIVISNFHTKSLADSTFEFKSNDFPHAEIIDLR